MKLSEIISEMEKDLVKLNDLVKAFAKEGKYESSQYCIGKSDLIRTYLPKLKALNDDDYWKKRCEAASLLKSQKNLDGNSNQ